MEMNETEPASVMIQEYWAMMVRRKWLVLGAIVAGVVAAGVLCLVLPKSYRSSTLILIENQKIPDDYVKGIGGASIDERLTMIQQQVMSRTLLSQLIDEFNLYGGQVAREGVESTIEEMRKVIKVETVGTTGVRGKSVEAITISFSHENPTTAMKVTAKLASLFIEENLKVREQLVMGVSTFLEQELQEAKKALEAQEQAISQYKSKHIGLLPEQMESNLRALDRLQTDLTATGEMLHAQTDKLSMVEKSIKEYEASGTTQSAPGTLTTAHAGMDPLVGRLRELERALTTLLAEYKETYPDIVQTKQEIESVKKQLAAKYGDLTEGKDGDVAKAFDPYLKELIKHRNELRAEVSSVRDRRQRLAEHIRAFELRVEQTPSREQDLMILMRDYENMQKNYQALLDKRLNAHVAVNLEKRQKGEQFRVLDPANLPQKLDKPNRLLIMVLGLLGGCGVGVSLAIGLDQVNPTFKRREEVERLPGIRMLAAIPNFHSGYYELSHQAKSSFVSAEEGLSLPAVRAGRKSPGWLSGPREEGPSLSPLLNLVAKWQPFSIAAEQYRMAATRIELSKEGQGARVIVVTSALKGEGKTTTVVNLGYTLARNLGRKTLLIDCDFRCPMLHKYANIPVRAGLIELLDGDASLESCLSAIDEVSCSILSVGQIGADFNEMVRIQQLRAILPEIRIDFDYIIINAPPVLPSASVGMLANLADLLVMVIRAGSTPKHAVQQAFTMLGLSGDAHVILNAVEAQSMPSYMYGYPMLYRGGDEKSVESVAR